MRLATLQITIETRLKTLLKELITCYIHTDNEKWEALENNNIGKVAEYLLITNVKLFALLAGPTVSRYH